MLKRTYVCFAAAIGVLCGSFPIVAAAAPPVRTMYTDAMVREQAVRAELAAPGTAPVLLGDVRTVVAAYEAVVRQYPASGYSDNALWQAGRLLLDAFERFGEAADREAGVLMLRRLAATYPTSKLVKQVPEQLARVDAQRGAEPRIGVARPGSVAAEPRVGPAAVSIATIKEIRRSVLPDAVRITIELDAEVTFHEERLVDPARVFLDLPATRAAPSLVDQTIRFESDADIVRQVRVGRHPNNATRVVLDAAGVTSYSVYPLYSPYRLVIDCVRVPAAAAAVAMTNTVLTRVPPAAPLSARPGADAATTSPRTLAPLPARSLTGTRLRGLPTMSPRATSRLAAALERTEAPKVADAAPVAPLPAAVPASHQTSESSAAGATRATGDGADAAPAQTRRPLEGVPAPLAPLTHPIAEGATAPPAHNATGGLSMARQLGLGVSRIVIDPGHGGHDPGAKGKGVTEAELVLDVALRLEKLLQKLSGVEVILTRRTDEFIPLPERTAIANREGADLFLSIHANASANTQAHGIETYFLNFANNQSAAAVAARENAASAQAMGGLPEFVKAIALNNKLDESRDFALHVQRAMVERQKTANRTLKDLGVKQAPFVVLIGANMPSVLAETGFVTNGPEAKLLKGNAYRQRIAESLLNAIRKYQASLKNGSTVAHR